MRNVHDLGQLHWHVAGFTPFQWCGEKSMEIGASPNAEIPPVPAPVPGSVQTALRRAGLLPDWNSGLNARLCEWVEHRDWIYETRLPDAWLQEGRTARLRCLGLDYRGAVRLNGREVGRFEGTFEPHVFDLTPLLAKTGNVLQIVFDGHPNWLGQFGHTSRMQRWKARFYYTWDWVPRLVQIGIWDAISLEVTDGDEFTDLSCSADADPVAGTGRLAVAGQVAGEAGTAVHVALVSAGAVVREETVSRETFAAGLSWQDLPVDLWWPHTHGPQPLYTVTCRLLDPQGAVRDEAVRQVGFRHVAWEPCEGAPAGADPWLCVVNGRRVFLQGVNWTPIRPNFADVTDDEVLARLDLYRQLGCNILRVWGGAVLERTNFYRGCDERGILVWQEFPLSSSGLDNWPPEDEPAIRDLARIAASYVQRRRHHASLLLWCGGNELQGDLQGRKLGCGRPVDDSHPTIARLKQAVAQRDPGRRFLATSSSGPRFCAAEDDFGKGLHWDVHGPWKVEGDLDRDWTRYWQHDDALLRSETGCPGASSAELIRQYAGECDVMPANLENPLWRRFAWWIEWPRFLEEHGRAPADLEEYVAWSQARQARALAFAARATKGRFPRVGGLILWMGHDSFPTTANTSIVDFHGRPKPAALALAEVFHEPADA